MAARNRIEQARKQASNQARKSNKKRTNQIRVCLAKYCKPRYQASKRPSDPATSAANRPKRWQIKIDGTDGIDKIDSIEVGVRCDQLDHQPVGAYDFRSPLTLTSYPQFTGFCYYRKRKETERERTGTEREREKGGTRNRKEGENVRQIVPIQLEWDPWTSSELSSLAWCLFLTAGLWLLILDKVNGGLRYCYSVPYRVHRVDM